MDLFMKNLNSACMIATISLSLFCANSFAQGSKPQSESTKLQQDVQSALVHDKLDAVAIDVGEPMIQNVSVSKKSDAKPTPKSAHKKQPQKAKTL